MRRHSEQEVRRRWSSAATEPIGLFDDMTSTMTYRKSPQRAAAKRQWDHFVSRNQSIIIASGIPAAVFTSIDHFDDFLRRGYFDHHVDSREFRVDSLSAAQYNALVTLTESYFAAGYEWFTPLALQSTDQDTLRTRFEK
jgi:hypothetical protein